MIDWLPWGREAFARSERERKPVFMLLHCDGVEGWVGALGLHGAERLISERFVPMGIGLWERPDVYVRHRAAARGGGDFAGLILGSDGQVLVEDAAGPGLADAVARLSDRYAPRPRSAQVSGPIWTGATSSALQAALDPAWPPRVFEEVKRRAASGPALERGCLEALVFAGAEERDADALALAARRLQPDAVFADVETLARYARACSEAAALELPGAEAEAARRAEQLLAFRDAGTGLFSPTPGKAPYSAGSALAALALLRASAVLGRADLREAALAALEAVRLGSFDPVLGVVRSRGPRGIIYGLLEDNAWTLLAFTEAYLMTGDKGRREFAVDLARFLFQELWERERGAFLDHAPSEADLGLMRDPVFPLEANAAAFEALWRVSEVTGNAHYRRWVELGLRRLEDETAASRAWMFADLARVERILARGRADLELVGRLGDPRTTALLDAVHRQYAPRKIVSFVDPDDQDYVQAHKLVSPSYPRLFACVDLKRVADADDPAGVPALVRRLR